MSREPMLHVHDLGRRAASQPFVEPELPDGAPTAGFCMTVGGHGDLGVGACVPRDGSMKEWKDPIRGVCGFQQLASRLLVSTGARLHKPLTLNPKLPESFSQFLRRRAGVQEVRGP